LKRDYLFVVVDEDVEAVEGLSFLLGTSHTEEIFHLNLAVFYMDSDVIIWDEYFEVSMTNFGADLFKDLIHISFGVKEVRVELLAGDLVWHGDEPRGFVASPQTLNIQNILIFKSTVTSPSRLFNGFTLGIEQL